MHSCLLVYFVTGETMFSSFSLFLCSKFPSAFRKKGINHKQMPTNWSLHMHTKHACRIPVQVRWTACNTVLAKIVYKSNHNPPAVAIACNYRTPLILPQAHRGVGQPELSGALLEGMRCPLVASKLIAPSADHSPAPQAHQVLVCNVRGADAPGPWNMKTGSYHHFINTIIFCTN